MLNKMKPISIICIAALLSGCYSSRTFYVYDIETNKPLPGIFVVATESSYLISIADDYWEIQKTDDEGKVVFKLAVPAYVTAGSKPYLPVGYNGPSSDKTVKLRLSKNYGNTCNYFIYENVFIKKSYPKSYIVPSPLWKEWGEYTMWLKSIDYCKGDDPRFQFSQADREQVEIIEPKRNYSCKALKVK